MTAGWWLIFCGVHVLFVLPFSFFRWPRTILYLHVSRATFYGFLHKRWGKNSPKKIRTQETWQTLITLMGIFDYFSNGFQLHQVPSAFASLLSWPPFQPNAQLERHSLIEKLAKFESRPSKERFWRGQRTYVALKRSEAILHYGGQKRTTADVAVA